MWYCVLFFLILVEINGQHIINLPDGKVQISKIVDSSKIYYGVGGIPFAKPPTSLLRFKAPKKNDKWDGVLTNNFNHKCVQQDGTGTEDCLYLNVYSSDFNLKNQSVMVWIHPGTFTEGYAGKYNPEFLIRKGVVIVIINYRLEAFGFLSTLDENIPGNFGIKDQIMALKWVQENIEYFGGNKNSVTVFGESAGAASIGVLIVSKKAKNLFHRAIMQSGNPLVLWGRCYTPRKNAFTIGQNLGINTKDSKILLEELLTKTTKEIYNASTFLTGPDFLSSNPLQGLGFAPVIEPHSKEAVFTCYAYENLLRGNFNKVPAIIGRTSQEAKQGFAAGEQANLLLQYYKNVSNLVPLNLNQRDSKLKKMIGTEMKNHYWGLGDIADAPLENIIQFLSDLLFNRATYETQLLMSRKTTVYSYVFAYKGKMGSSSYWDYDDVGHAEDVPYIFKNTTDGEPEDYNIVKTMTELWTNFAIYGDPTPFKSVFFWEPSSEFNNMSYMLIDKDLTMKKGPTFEKQDFNEKIYTYYGVHPLDTY